MAKPLYLQELYKKTATGAIQKWLIGVEGTTIVTHYGQVGGKIQTTKDSVKSGKNQGRKNETVPEEQARKEAIAQWTKKKKAGYVESLEDAESGKTDAIIEGGVVPMLAKVYQDNIAKVGKVVAVQPKLDGGRMICIIDDQGSVSLWTRTRKRVFSMDHISERMAHLARKLNWRSMVLDGEVYNHEFKNDFEKLMSAFRKDKSTPEAKKLQYHVYDVVSPLGFKERIGPLSDITLHGGSSVRAVDTVFISRDVVMEYYQKWAEEGYEGAMVRQLDRGYENKRSDQLLKLKMFQDAEFKIVDIEEGRGKLIGHAGNFICITADGKEFGVKMAGELSTLKHIYASCFQLAFSLGNIAGSNAGTQL